VACYGNIPIFVIGFFRFVFQRFENSPLFITFAPDLSYIAMGGKKGPPARPARPASNGVMVRLLSSQVLGQ
jgi:hypothetical protein